MVIVFPLVRDIDSDLSDVIEEDSFLQEVEELLRFGREKGDETDPLILILDKEHMKTLLSPTLVCLPEFAEDTRSKKLI